MSKPELQLITTPPLVLNPDADKKKIKEIQGRILRGADIAAECVAKGDFERFNSHTYFISWEIQRLAAERYGDGV